MYLCLLRCFPCKVENVLLLAKVLNHNLETVWPGHNNSINIRTHNNINSAWHTGPKHCSHLSYTVWLSLNYTQNIKPIWIANHFQKYKYTSGLCIITVAYLPNRLSWTTYTEHTLRSISPLGLVARFSLSK